MGIRPDGGAFKHRKLEDAEGESAYYPIVGVPVGDGADQQDEDGRSGSFGSIAIQCTVANDAYNQNTSDH